MQRGIPGTRRSCVTPRSTWANVDGKITLVVQRISYTAVTDQPRVTPTTTRISPRRKPTNVVPRPGCRTHPAHKKRGRSSVVRMSFPLCTSLATRYLYQLVMLARAVTAVIPHVDFSEVRRTEQTAADGVLMSAILTYLGGRRVPVDASGPNEYSGLDS